MLPLIYFKDSRIKTEILLQLASTLRPSVSALSPSSWLLLFRKPLLVLPLSCAKDSSPATFSSTISRAPSSQGHTSLSSSPCSSGITRSSGRSLTFLIKLIISYRAYLTNFLLFCKSVLTDLHTRKCFFSFFFLHIYYIFFVITSWIE